MVQYSDLVGLHFQKTKCAGACDNWIAADGSCRGKGGGGSNSADDVSGQGWTSSADGFRATGWYVVA